MPKYFLKSKKSEIEPEEILLDKKSATKLEIPLQKNGLAVIFLAAAVFLTIFWGRSFWLQILKGDYYSERSNKNNVRIYRSRPPRGIIYDRNFTPLTDNEADFSLAVIPADVPKGEAFNAWAERLEKILNKNGEEITSFMSGIDKTSTQPVVFDSGFDREILLDLESHQPDLPGVFINKETERNYVDGSYFSHVLGYIGKVSNENLRADSYYSLQDYIGKSGLEAQYEKELRGTPGKIAVFVNSDNTVLNTLTAEDPAPGNNLVLSIDNELQKILTDSLKIKMEETGSGGAAAVVINVKTGEILSLVSLPTFNNNSFSSGLSGETYQNIAKDKNRPMFNRAISGTYPSGSTIKPFIASAALAENTIDPNYKVDDTLGYITVPNQYNPDVTYVYHDWRPQGFVDMRRAIAISANVYFYVIGGGYKSIKGLGIDRIDKYLKLFGFGSELGIDIPGEADGLVPSPAWKKAVKKESWFTGDTYNVSIGQGDVLVTPLQMALGVSAIANGGTLYKPMIVSKITDDKEKYIKQFNPEEIRKINIDSDKLQIVREGMRGTITEGSARSLNDLPIKVAGKTGTAQVTNTFRKTNAWFTGFAPYDNPEIALAIIIEGAGEGSTAAVPVAKEIFWWYYMKSLSRN